MDSTSIRHASLAPTLAAAACLLLASCGGGGGDAASPAPAAAANPPASAPVVGATTTASTCNLPNFQASLLARINQVRATGADCGVDGVFGAAAPVVWNDRLTA